MYFALQSTLKPSVHSGRCNYDLKKPLVYIMAHENLYDSLGYNVPPDDLTLDEKSFLAETIPKLSQEKKELVYMLVLHDYVKSNPSTKVIFPYKSKQTTTNRLEIKVDALPIKLKRILHKFVTLAASDEIESTPISP